MNEMGYTQGQREYRSTKMVSLEEAAMIGQANAEVENNFSSVKIIHNSKGTNWEIKIYDANPEIAYNTSIDIDERLRNKYGGT